MRVRVPLLACVVALVVAAPAGAATVSMPFVAHVAPSKEAGPIDVYALTFEAAAGETNRVVADDRLLAEGLVRVRDAGAAPTPGENCAAEPGGSVVCRPRGTAPPRLQRADLRLGDGDDELVLNGLQAAVSAGAGDDRVVSPDAGVSVDGGPGADYMRAPSGAVSYPGRTLGVRVTPDGVPDDGEPGEGDDVGPTFSVVSGGDGPDELHAPADPPYSWSRLDGRGGDDRLFGAGTAASLIGGDGDDSLIGGGGRDVLDGGAGADLIRGGANFDVVEYGALGPVDVTLDDRRGDGTEGENDDAGADVESVVGSHSDDRIVGSGADNVIDGRGGADVLDGAGGADRIVLHGPGGRATGGPGRDAIDAEGSGGTVDTRDGERDEVRCGLHPNTFSFDALDVFLRCAPSLTVPSGRTYGVSRDGLVRPLVRCHGAGYPTCAGTIRLYRRGDVGRPGAQPIGRARFSVRGDGKSARVAVRLVNSVRAEITRGRRLRVDGRWRTTNTDPPSRQDGGFKLKLVRAR